MSGGGFIGWASSIAFKSDKYSLTLSYAVPLTPFIIIGHPLGIGGISGSIQVIFLDIALRIGVFQLNS